MGEHFQKETFDLELAALTVPKHQTQENATAAQAMLEEVRSAYLDIVREVPLATTPERVASLHLRIKSIEGAAISYRLQVATNVGTDNNRAESSLADGFSTAVNDFAIHLRAAAPRI